MDALFESVQSRLVNAKDLLISVQKVMPYKPVLTVYSGFGEDEENLMITVKKDIINFANNTIVPADRINAMVATLDCICGCIHLENNDFTSADEALNAALDRVIEDRTCEVNVLVKVRTLNELGMLYMRTQSLPRAINALTTAYQLYASFEVDRVGYPLSLDEVLNNETRENYGEAALKVAHIYTGFYLAQSHKLAGNNVLSSLFCFETLRIQLESGPVDYVDWVLNVATLSQFFIEKNLFDGARHLLSSALMMLDSYDRMIPEIEDYEVMMAEKNNYNSCRAEVARCRAKYASNLLMVSKDRLMEEEIETPPGPLQGLYFPEMRNNKYENITCDFLLTYQDCIPVFNDGIHWINEACNYYTFEDQASEYIRLQQEKSALNRHLAFFEDDDWKRIDIFKRRLFILGSILQHLNSEHYMDFMRELWFEVGECFWEIADIKLSMFQELSQRPDEVLIQGVMTFDKLILSFPQAREPDIPKVSNQEIIWIESHILRAKCLAAMTPHTRQRLFSISASAIKDYLFIIAYYEKWYPTNAANPSTDMGRDCLDCRDMIHSINMKLSRMQLPTLLS